MAALPIEATTGIAPPEFLLTLVHTVGDLPSNFGLLNPLKRGVAHGAPGHREVGLQVEVPEDLDELCVEVVARDEETSRHALGEFPVSRQESPVLAARQGD